MSKWVVIQICFLLSQSAFGENIELKNLRSDWYAYDEGTKQLLPFYRTSQNYAVQFDLNLKKYKGAQFKLNCPKDYFLWINEDLVHQFNGRDTYFDVDSIYKVYSKDKLKIVIYGSDFIADSVETTIVKVVAKETNSDMHLFFAKRENSNSLNRFIQITIFTLALIAVFRTLNFRLFKEYFAFGKSLQTRQNFDLITAHSPLAWPNIGFIFFYAILVSNSSLNFDLFSDQKMELIDGLNMVLLCFVLMSAKFILIYLCTELFKIKKVRLTHFFTYFRLSLILALGVFCLSILNGIFDGQLMLEYKFTMKLILGLLWFIRLILIFFVLNKIYTFRKLHLFSYLCSSELIPLLLFFKVFLK